MSDTNQYAIFQKDNKYIPFEKTTSDNGQAFYGSLSNFLGEVRESGSHGFNPDFKNGFESLKAAKSAIEKKWGENIQPKVIPLKEKYYEISNRKGAVAVETALVHAGAGKILKSTISGIRPYDPDLSAKGYKQMQARIEQHPNMASDTIRAKLKSGELSRKECDLPRANAIKQGKVLGISALERLKQQRAVQSNSRGLTR